MNKKRKKLPVNYSIQNIVDSMLSDNPVAKSYTDPKKKKLLTDVYNRKTIEELLEIIRQDTIRQVLIQNIKILK